MASRFFKRVGSLLGRPHLVTGRFTSDSSATADTNDRGYTVSQTATGRWTVTFDDAWQNTPNVVAGLEISSTGTGDQTITTISVSSTSFIVECFDNSGGALADVASGFITFIAMIDDSNS